MNPLQCPYYSNGRCDFEIPKLEDPTLAMKLVELHWNCHHKDIDSLDLMKLDCSAHWCSYSTNPPMKAELAVQMLMVHKDTVHTHDHFLPSWWIFMLTASLGFLIYMIK